MVARQDLVVGVIRCNGMDDGMHELPVTENILEIAIRHATEAGAARVTDIHLVVGELSSIVDDSVQFYWDMISEGTIAAGAALHFTRLAITLHCLNCDHHYAPSGEDFACPQCSSERVEIEQGEEFYLESVEIERV
ncbi:MAG: hydrogenase maturation nickel metallochaperone HypA [Anaerolineales bacterium]|nr:hydrogenase maturation nickel metallochaperone HypA [Anaerolineales bacterium]